VRALKFPNRAICYKEQAKGMDSFTYMFNNSRDLGDCFCYISVSNNFSNSSHNWCPLREYLSHDTILFNVTKNMFTESWIPIY
jgi:hypothetical protein